MTNVSTSDQDAGTPRAGPVVRRVGAPDPTLELREFLRALLQYQGKLIGALGGVAYITETGGRRGGVIATDAAGERTVRLLERQENQRKLAAVAERSIQSPAQANGTLRGLRESVSLEADGAGVYASGPTHVALASPLTAEGRVEGACVLVLPPDRSEQADEALSVLALTNARFEAFLWRQHALTEGLRRERLTQTLELLDAAQQGSDAPAMGSLMCHELARRFGCTRVSIGLIRNDRMRLAAVSGADRVDRRADAVREIESAMDECADQDVEVFFPPVADAESDPSQRRVTREHERLSRSFGPSAIVSLPLRVEGEQIGVLLLERPTDDPFPAGSASLLRLVAEFVGPAMWTRRLADRGVLAVARDRALDAASWVVGPRHAGAKLIGMTAALIVLLLAVVPIPGRVSGRCELEAESIRTVSPPYSGYLRGVEAKPGDRVERGQLLATMDTFELDTTLLEARARRATLVTQRDDSRAKGELAEVPAINASIEEADARIALLEDRLAHATIRAPIAGTISRGELESLVNARVEPDQPLFEIVGDRTLVVINVRERDASRVRVGQEGTLVTRARPSEPVRFRVVSITPVAEVVAQQNVYTARGEIPDPPGWLHPGMTGTARLKDRGTTVLWVILRPVVDEARLRLWW